MPTYLYLCEVNNEEFEEFHSMSKEMNECAICKEKNMGQHKPKRLICGSSKGVVKLTGDELVAKTKEDTKKLKQEIYSDANKYANVLGEAKYHNLQTRLDRRNR